MKAVITCGGLGTRLFPFTKELPKEMAPVFLKTENSTHTIPLIQIIFETLYDVGIREFCFITGKTKRSIENHFTPNSTSQGKIMDSFYNKLKNSIIYWVTQNEPKGFGDAVKYAKSFVGLDYFILQAGDVAIVHNKINILKKMIEFSETKNQDIVLAIREVSDPKRHGIVELEDDVSEISNVKQAIEKPDAPPTNLGIMPIYLFNQNIFDALENTLPGKNDEIQLTDAIQKIIEEKKIVKAVRVDQEKFWDVGTPEAYWDALNDSYHYKQEL